MEGDQNRGRDGKMEGRGKQVSSYPSQVQIITHQLVIQCCHITHSFKNQIRVLLICCPQHKNFIIPEGVAAPAPQLGSSYQEG